MKKLSFALLFFTAIAWLWIGHMMGADTVYQRVGGNTVISGELGGGGSGLTNENVNSWVIFTNNGVSISLSSSGIFTLTNYAAAGLGWVWSTNGSVTNFGTPTALTVQSSTANSPTNQVWRYTDGTIRMSQGVHPSANTYTGLWFGNVVPGAGNWTFLGNGAGELGFNVPNANGVMNFRFNNTPSSGGLVQITHNVTTFNTNVVSSASITATNSFQLPTNYVAANFTPVAGMVKIVSSNGVLYKVTQLSTNLLGPDTP